MNSMQPRRNVMRAKGAAGKALLVWLVSGSAGLALVAYLLFNATGC